MSGAPSILFLEKRGDAFATAAGDLLEHAGARLTRHAIGRGEKLPEAALSWSGDLIVSYLCPAMISPALLARAKVAAINFHPGTPEYPGTGCINFALYEGAATYGPTCHHMAPAADSGPIVAVRRFALTEADTVWTALMRTYVEMFEMFRELLPILANGGELPRCAETWTRPAFRRQQLENLCMLDSSMDRDEIRRRIRATRFPGAPGAYIEQDGLRFEYSEGR